MVSTRPVAIALFGPPQVTVNGRPLTLARRQARALLYRLAATTRPIPREQLTFLLWPDVPEEAARRNLTVLLSQLRQALPPATLLNDTAGICLDPGLVRVDVAEAAALASAGRRDGALGQLAAAADLYRGLFLDGVGLPDAHEFESWLTQERQAWERWHLDLLSTLLEGYTVAGEYPAAIATAKRALAADPLAEELHRRLIELYGAQGDRVAALRQFEQCVVVLERELGVAPLPATRAAYEAVRDGKRPDLQGGVEGGAARPVLRPSDSRLVSPSLAVDAVSTELTPLALPAPANPLIGRTSEVADLVSLLQRADLRLLTLIGPGGSGKTRLALEVLTRVAPSFPDGVGFVPLGPLHDPALLLDAIARACGVRSAGAASTAATLASALRGRRMLIVLDNVEHLLPAVPQLAELLRVLPDLRLLVTSRSVLHLSGEHVFSVPPLPVPDLASLPPAEELAAQPAVALLVARTRALNPHFSLTADNAEDLAAVCVRLDGLPLALELAAARLRLMTPQALLKRLEHSLGLLNQGPRDLPERQRNLRAVIAWSYGLLDRKDRHVFARLSVFAGGWTLHAAEAICAAGLPSQHVLDSLQALLNASLVFVDVDAKGEPRFRMLETVREYALEWLRERGDEDEVGVHRRHATYFCEYLEQHAPGLGTHNLLSALETIDQEYHNIRAALHWSFERGEAMLGARMFVLLVSYWDLRGLIQEGAVWLNHVMPLVPALPQSIRTRVYSSAGLLAYRRGQSHETAALAAAALTDAVVPSDITAALNRAGEAALQVGDPSAARQYALQMLAIAEEHELVDGIAVAHLNLGLLCLTQGNLVEAELEFQSAHAGYMRLGLEPSIGLALVGLGFTAFLRGDEHGASAKVYDGLKKLSVTPSKSMMLYGLMACCVLAGRRQPRLAATIYGAVLRQAERAGLRVGGPIWALGDAQITALRALLGQEAFTQAYEQGWSLSIEVALTLALTFLEQ